MVTESLRRFGALALLLAAGLALASCGPKEEEGTPSNGPARPPKAAAAPAVKIKIITNGISPFWDPMAIGMERAARQFNCDASWAGPQNAQIPEQKQLIEDAISSKVDGLAVSAIEAPAITPSIDAAMDANILTITFDSDAPKSKRILYIGTNNFKAGQSAGEQAKKVFAAGGKIIGFVGNLTAENARDRINGFKDAIKGTKIELVEVIADDKDKNSAQRNVEDVIQSRKDIVGLLGFYSYNGPAIVRAVQGANAGSRFKVLAFDAEPDTMKALQSGQMEFTVVQKPYEFGFRSVEFLYKAKTEGVEKAKQELKAPADNILDTGVEIVTPQNYPDFKRRMEALGIKSS